MANYESFLLVDQEDVGIEVSKLEELMQYAMEIYSELNVYAKQNSDLKDQIDSIMNNFKERIEEFSQAEMSKKEEKIASIKTYELIKQLISDLKVIKRTFENDS